MAKEKELVPEMEQVETPQVEQPQVTEEISSDDYRSVVKRLVAQGAKQFKNVKVKNVTLTDMGSYIRVGLTLVSELPAYNSDGEEVTNNIVFTSLYALGAMLKDNEETAWAVNAIMSKPQLLNMILCGSTVDLLQRRYEAGVDIYNPYSKNPNQTPNVYDHRTIITDVNELHLGKVALKMIDKIANRMIDSAISDVE